MQPGRQRIRHHRKRRVLYVTQASAGLLAAVFAVLTGTHEMRLWTVYVLAIALGFVNVPG